MKKFTRAQVLDAISKRVRLDGLRSTAREVKVDPGYLSRALAGKNPFSDGAAAKFGFKREESLYTHKQAATK